MIYTESLYFSLCCFWVFVCQWVVGCGHSAAKVWTLKSFKKSDAYSFFLQFCMIEMNFKALGATQAGIDPYVLRQLPFSVYWFWIISVLFAPLVWSWSCSSSFTMPLHIHICRELDLRGREMLLDVAFGGQKCLKQEDNTGKHRWCISAYQMRYT